MTGRKHSPLPDGDGSFYRVRKVRGVSVLELVTITRVLPSQPAEPTSPTRTKPEAEPDMRPPEISPHASAIEDAAAWLAKPLRETIGRPIVPYLREKYGLSLQETVEAIRQANLRRARAT